MLIKAETQLPMPMRWSNYVNNEIKILKNILEQRHPLKERIKGKNRNERKR